MSDRMHLDLNWDQVTKRVAMMQRGPSNKVAFAALEYLHREAWPQLEPLEIMHMLHGDSRVVVAVKAEHEQQRMFDLMGL